jgi:putative ABC transport system permease protein
MAAAAGLTRFLQGLLHGVPALDAPTYALAAASLAAAALLACAVPAARAARVDPLQALRHE